MGWIRGFFTVIISVLLFFSLFAVNLFGILSSSLTYENVYENSQIIFENILYEINISKLVTEKYPLLVLYCQNNSKVIFGEGDYVFNISCKSVMQGTEEIMQEGIESIVKKVYYGNYSENLSNYINSPQQTPFFIISEKAYNLTNKIFNYSLLLLIILIIILFFLVENKSNTFLLPGIFMTLLPLIFIKVNSFLSSNSENIIFQFMSIFFSKSFPVSIRILIVGILLIILAIIFKTFKVGFWISSFINKFKKSPQKPQEESSVIQTKKK